MSRNDRENVRHPFGQADDVKVHTKHCPCAVKTHIPGQHTRSGRNSMSWSHGCMILITNDYHSIGGIHE